MRALDKSRPFMMRQTISPFDTIPPNAMQIYDLNTRYTSLSFPTMSTTSFGYTQASVVGHESGAPRSPGRPQVIPGAYSGAPMNTGRPHFILGAYSGASGSPGRPNIMAAYNGPPSPGHQSIFHGVENRPPTGPQNHSLSVPVVPLEFGLPPQAPSTVSPIFPPKLQTKAKKARSAPFATSSTRNTESDGRSPNNTMSERTGPEIENEIELKAKLLVRITN